MAGKRRVTQADVARAVGVDASTVSLALRNHPSIPESTRAKIRAAVQELGYEPDPMLAALATYRTSLRPAEYHGTVAWLSSVHQGDHMWWYGIGHFRDYYEGAKKCAQDLGYRLEHFDLSAPGMTPARMASILKARNISGILLCPQPMPNAELEFPWESFSSVTFGYTLAKPQMHLVTTAHFRATVTTMRALLSKGYRRIGFSVSPNHDEKVEHNFLAGYYTELGLNGLPAFPLQTEWNPVEELKGWIREHRLEAIITGNYTGYQKFQDLGFTIPEQLGIACPALGSAGTVSGVLENSFRIGEVAMDFLSARIYRGEKGVPETPLRILVDGAWHSGTTLRETT